MKKKPRPKKRLVDEYLMNLEENNYVQLKGDYLRKIKEIPSDHEDLMNPKDLNMLGGVDLIDDVRTKFTKGTVKYWFEYSSKWGLCRCNAPVEMKV